MPGARRPTGTRPARPHIGAADQRFDGTRRVTCCAAIHVGASTFPRPLLARRRVDGLRSRAACPQGRKGVRRHSRRGRWGAEIHVKCHRAQLGPIPHERLDRHWQERFGKVCAPVANRGNRSEQVVSGRLRIRSPGQGIAEVESDLVFPAPNRPERPLTLQRGLHKASKENGNHRLRRAYARPGRASRRSGRRPRGRSPARRPASSPALYANLSISPCQASFCAWPCCVACGGADLDQCRANPRTREGRRALRGKGDRHLLSRPPPCSEFLDFLAYQPERSSRFSHWRGSLTCTYFDM